MNNDRILKLASSLDKSGHIDISNDLMELCDFSKIASQSESVRDYKNILAGKVLEIRNKNTNEDLSEELREVTSKIFNEGELKIAAWRDTWQNLKNWGGDVGNAMMGRGENVQNQQSQPSIDVERTTQGVKQQFLNNLLGPAQEVAQMGNYLNSAWQTIQGHYQNYNNLIGNLYNQYSEVLNSYKSMNLPKNVDQLLATDIIDPIYKMVSHLQNMTGDENGIDVGEATQVANDLVSYLGGEMGEAMNSNFATYDDFKNQQMTEQTQAPAQPQTAPAQPQNVADVSDDNVKKNEQQNLNDGFDTISVEDLERSQQSQEVNDFLKQYKDEEGYETLDQSILEEEIQEAPSSENTEITKKYLESLPGFQELKGDWNRILGDKNQQISIEEKIDQINRNSGFYTEFKESLKKEGIDLGQAIRLLFEEPVAEESVAEESVVEEPVVEEHAVKETRTTKRILNELEKATNLDRMLLAKYFKDSMAEVFNETKNKSVSPKSKKLLFEKIKNSHEMNDDQLSKMKKILKITEPVEKDDLKEKIQDTQDSTIKEDVDKKVLEEIRPSTDVSEPQDTETSFENMDQQKSEKSLVDNENFDHIINMSDEEAARALQEALGLGAITEPTEDFTKTKLEGLPPTAKPTEDSTKTKLEGLPPTAKPKTTLKGKPPTAKPKTTLKGKPPTKKKNKLDQESLEEVNTEIPQDTVVEKDTNKLVKPQPISRNIEKKIDSNYGNLNSVVDEIYDIFENNSLSQDQQNAFLNLVDTKISNDDNDIEALEIFKNNSERWLENVSNTNEVEPKNESPVIAPQNEKADSVEDQIQDSDNDADDWTEEDIEDIREDYSGMSDKSFMKGLYATDPPQWVLDKAVDKYNINIDKDDEGNYLIDKMDDEEIGGDVDSVDTSNMSDDEVVDYFYDQFGGLSKENFYKKLSNIMSHPDISENEENNIYRNFVEKFNPKSSLKDMAKYVDDLGVSLIKGKDSDDSSKKTENKNEGYNKKEFENLLNEKLKEYSYDDLSKQEKKLFNKNVLPDIKKDILNSIKNDTERWEGEEFVEEDNSYMTDDQMEDYDRFGSKSSWTTLSKESSWQTLAKDEFKARQPSNFSNNNKYYSNVLNVLNSIEQSAQNWMIASRTIVRAMDDLKNNLESYKSTLSKEDFENYNWENINEGLDSLKNILLSDDINEKEVIKMVGNIKDMINSVNTKGLGKAEPVFYQNYFPVKKERE